MNPFLINIIGYIGLVINLFSMSVNGEKKLRLFSLIANSIYIVYGIFLGAFPVIIGSSIAVFLHGYRINKMNRDKNND
jgi:membrane-bound ClpP family serine protease